MIMWLLPAVDTWKHVQVEENLFKLALVYCSDGAFKRLDFWSSLLVKYLFLIKLSLFIKAYSIAGAPHCCLQVHAELFESNFLVSSCELILLH